jgi:hypothetical protein
MLMRTGLATQILAASRQWLKPVIYVLIRCGISYREFSELARTTYVEVATERFGKRGRPTNISRTAVLTGLSRREVRKQRDMLDSSPEPFTGYVTKASLVLSAWHLDPQFLNPQGRPKYIEAEGDGATFASLVRRCGGSDVPASTLLKELLSANAVRVRADGKLQALQRNFIPHEIDEELIRLWGTVVADVAHTFAHNMTRMPKAPARFERAAVNEQVAASALPEFRIFLQREGQAFLEKVDAWLTEHQATDEDSIRLGVGVYHIQD